MEEQLTNPESTEPTKEIKKMAGLFGNLDMDKVSDNPFEIAPSTYRSVVVDSTVEQNEDGSAVWKWEYRIDEPGNEYHNHGVKERYGLWPNKTWEEYAPEQKKATKFLKQRLRKAFDLTKEQIDAVQPDDIMGKVVYITIVLNPSNRPGDDRKFTNVRNAVSERLYEEQGGTASDNNAVKTGATLGI